MKQYNLLITASAICLLCTAVAKAKSTDKPSDFQKLQMEYHEKAEDKIAPLNDRYKDELESMLKKKMKNGTSKEIEAIQNEIKELGVNPAILLEELENTYLAQATDLTLADFEGDWFVTYSDEVETRFSFDSEGNIKSTDSNAGRSRMKLGFDPKTGKFVAKFRNGAETFSISHGKLKTETWWGRRKYPNDNPNRNGTGKLVK